MLRLLTSNHCLFCLFQVFCDMETDGGGWTVIQRRKVGLTSFNRDWKQYKEGFGNIKGDFWLGNENIYRLSRRPTVLRVELEVINKLLISAAKDFFISQYQISSPVFLGGPKNLHALITGKSLHCVTLNFFRLFKAWI